MRVSRWSCSGWCGWFWLTLSHVMFYIHVGEHRHLKVAAGPKMMRKPTLGHDLCLLGVSFVRLLPRSCQRAPVICSSVWLFIISYFLLIRGQGARPTIVSSFCVAPPCCFSRMCANFPFEITTPFWGYTRKSSQLIVVIKFLFKNY